MDCWVMLGVVVVNVDVNMKMRKRSGGDPYPL